MLRLDRNDIPDLPRPIYEVLVDREGPEAIVAAMVGDETSLPCRVTQLAARSPLEFRLALMAWFEGLPYFGPDKRETWKRVAADCADRFTDHLFSE